MNVLLVAAECGPWSKTGRLGDVAGALPKALARRGHRVMVVVPKYGDYPEPKDTGVRKRYKVNGQDMEVSYYHAYIDGVDYVFIESSVFRHRQHDIYGGDRRISAYPKVTAVLVRNHGIYVWGDSWISAKTQLQYQTQKGSMDYQEIHGLKTLVVS